jgi:hypothetical protein
MNYDVIFPLGPNDVDLFKKYIKYNQQNILNYRNMYIVSYDPSIEVEGCITVNENKFLFLKEAIENKMGKIPRVGWYFQQLIKLYSHNIIDGLLDNYLVVDADIIFTKPTDFFISTSIDENNSFNRDATEAKDEILETNCKENQNKLSIKTKFNFSEQYHYKYFIHMEKLHPTLKKMKKYSGICDHMMFERKYLNELFQIIENYHSFSQNTKNLISSTLQSDESINNLPTQATEIWSSPTLRSGESLNIEVGVTEAKDELLETKCKEITETNPEFVETNHIENKKFYELFIEYIDPNDYFYGSGASEYEIYFNFMLKYHDDVVFLRHLNNKFVPRKDLDDYLGYEFLFYSEQSVDENKITYLTENMDYITSHHWLQ